MQPWQHYIVWALEGAAVAFFLFIMVVSFFGSRRG